MLVLYLGGHVPHLVTIVYYMVRRCIVSLLLMLPSFLSHELKAVPVVQP